MCNLLNHFCCYTFALNLIFTAYTLSPIFPNFLSSLKQMELTPSQVRNHHSQMNDEAQLETALAFKFAAYLHSPCHVCHSNIHLGGLYYGWLMSTISFTMRDHNNTDRDICDAESEATVESTFPSDIEEDKLNHKQEGFFLCHAHWDKLLWTTRVPLPKNKTCAENDIACLASKFPKSTCGNAATTAQMLWVSPLRQISKSDRAPSVQALPLPRASGDHDIPKHHKAAFEITNEFMEANEFTTTHWPILCDDKW